jgi:alkylated DNA nucleotide flippase Atl1
MKPRKTWREKLADDKDLPKVIKIAPKDRDRWKGATLVVPAPREVDALMQKIPKGKLVTINELRAALANLHGTGAACPITTGIFAWIAAHAAAEATEAGRKRVTPYWRTLKVGGELNAKYPGGIESLRTLLESEGHTVIQKGKKHLVRDFQKALVPMEKLL